MSSVRYHNRGSARWEALSEKQKIQIIKGDSMNKLEEYRKHYSLKCKTKYEEISFTEGFDAAIALDLPVKFAEWKEKEFNNNRSIFEKILKSFPNSFPEYKELYQYWVDNIYNPEV